MVAFAWVVIIAGLIVGFGDRVDQKHENPPVKGMTRIQKWSFGAAAIAAVYVIWAFIRFGRRFLNHIQASIHEGPNRPMYIQCHSFI